jgi:hypothetical protein
MKSVSGIFIIAILLLTACDQKDNTPVGKAVVKASPAPAAPTPKVATAPAVTGSLLGVWYDESLKTEHGEQIAYEIISYEKRVFIQPIAFTGKKLQVSDMPELSPSATELRKSKGVYINVNQPNEIYKVDKTGNLLIYDQTGLLATFKKVL